jgi:hypothetical protein
MNIIRLVAEGMRPTYIDILTGPKVTLSFLARLVSAGIAYHPIKAVRSTLCLVPTLVYSVQGVNRLFYLIVWPLDCWPCRLERLACC